MPLGLLDAGLVLGDNCDGGGDVVLAFLFRRYDVNVVAVGACHRVVDLTQKIPDNDMMPLRGMTTVRTPSSVNAWSMAASP